MRAIWCLARCGRMAWVCGVARLMNSAATLCSSISWRAFSPASLGSNLSSSVISLICSPCTPPRAFTWSRYRRTPTSVSPTLAATGPVTAVVWPIRIWACAATPPTANSSAAAARRQAGRTVKERGRKAAA